MLEEKRKKPLRAPGTQKKAGISGRQSKIVARCEFQFFQVCPEGSQNCGQASMAKIPRKSLLLFWLEVPGEKSPGKLHNQKVRGEKIYQILCLNSAQLSA